MFVNMKTKSNFLYNLTMKHQRGGKYVKDMVYGANDGIVTTFAVVAGVMGGGLPAIAIVLIGVASLFADAFSMAASNFLGSKSETEFYERERRIEEWEIENKREHELEETGEFLRQKGYEEDDRKKLTELISKNKEFWLDIMMREELDLARSRSMSSKVSAFATFVSFVAAGFVPLIPFLIWEGDKGALFTLAIFFTALALFFVGAVRTHFTGKNWVKAGFEMLLIGGIASVIAYTAGAVVKWLIG